MAAAQLSRGSVVVLEARRNGGPVRWAFPHYLVEQRPDLVALYLPIGTRGLAPADRHAVLRGDPPLPHVWHSHDVLRLVTPGAWHSVDCFSAEGGRFAGWYVNFQVPIEQRGDRFVTCDLELDIWVEPDRSWSWKDRDEYRQLIGLGLVTAAEAAAIEAEAEAVLARVQRASPALRRQLERLAARSGLGAVDASGYADLIDCASTHRPIAV